MGVYADQGGLLSNLHICYHTYILIGIYAGTTLLRIPDIWLPERLEVKPGKKRSHHTQTTMYKAASAAKASPPTIQGQSGGSKERRTPPSNYRTNET